MSARYSSESCWVSVRDPRLPEPLRQLVKPRVPGVSYAGDPSLLWRGVRVAIVGSRTARDDSIAIARRIAGELAGAGITIVSGLARGVDAAAHHAALDARGSTIAVVASGLARTYPTSNTRLARAISACPPLGSGVRAQMRADAPGLLVSEYGCGDTPAFRDRFPRRNRIIAALSDYVVVIQAARTSGSMHTAHAALDLGIPIGIGPVDPAAEAFVGTVSLIRDGADTVVDGRSVAHRLALHQVVPRGFAVGFDEGARVLDDRSVFVPDCADVRAAQHARLAAHPVGSLLDIPRAEEDLAELASLDLRAVRRALLELEAEGLCAVTDDGLWLAREPAART